MSRRVVSLERKSASGKRKFRNIALISSAFCNYCVGMRGKKYTLSENTISMRRIFQSRQRNATLCNVIFAFSRRVLLRNFHKTIDLACEGFLKINIKIAYLVRHKRVKHFLSSVSCADKR